MKIIKLPIIFLGCLIIKVSSYSQGFQIQKDSVYSSVLSEQRILNVVLPVEYKPGSGEKYDVLYLLDGDWNTTMVSELQNHLHHWEFTPPLIIVGIANTFINGANQRDRDLTPTHIAGAPLSGGAPQFLAFIKNELIPYVNGKYPSNGQNTIFGHSLGGLFTMYALLSEPGICKAYVAADPSFWWDNNYIHRLAAQKLSAVSGIRSLFITGREGRPLHEMKIDAMDSILKANAPPVLQWKIAAYADEIHVSDQLKSAYDGLKFTYAPYMKKGKIDIDPMGGITVKDKPFTLLCYNLLAYKYIRYTTNGSNPHAASNVMQFQNTIKLPGSAALKATSFFTEAGLNQSIAYNFTAGKVFPSHAKPAGAMPGGLHYACYAGEWDSTPDVKAMKPGLEGIAGPGVDISKSFTQPSFFCRQDGYLLVLQDGYYVFELGADKGAKIFVDKRLLINITENGGYQSFMVPLQKGFYPVRIEYFHKQGGGDFGLTYMEPGTNNDNPVPLERLYSVP